jgi:hypothetical protein
MSSEDISVRRLNNLRRISIDYNEGKNISKIDEIVPLSIERVETQYRLLDKIYALNEETYKGCIPKDMDYEEIKGNLKEDDKLALIMNLDEATKDYVLESMRCSLMRAEHTFSFLWTIKSQLTSLIIIQSIYENPNEEKTISESKDMVTKFNKREHIYDFWKKLSIVQKQKLLDWYNRKKPEEVLAHPASNGLSS